MDWVLGGIAFFANFYVLSFVLKGFLGPRMKIFGIFVYFLGAIGFYLEFLKIFEIEDEEKVEKFRELALGYFKSWTLIGFSGVLLIFGESGVDKGLLKIRKIDYLVAFVFFVVSLYESVDGGMVKDGGLLVLEISFGLLGIFVNYFVVDLMIGQYKKLEDERMRIKFKSRELFCFCYGRKDSVIHNFLFLGLLFHPFLHFMIIKLIFAKLPYLSHLLLLYLTSTPLSYTLSLNSSQPISGLNSNKYPIAFSLYLIYHLTLYHPNPN